MMTENRLGEIAIIGLGTAVPPFRMEQDDTARRLTEALALAGQADAGRWAKRLFRQCGVETRYTCEPNLLEAPGVCRYFPTGNGMEAPSTKERMNVYKSASVPLAMEAAKQALEDGKVRAEDVTHIVTVSCTGQFLPGMDTVLVRELGLSRAVVRLPLTFLGCAAGLKAVGLAKQLAAGYPDACVLIVCVELCTLHIQPSADKEALYGASFFGDGASACVVGTPKPGVGGCFLLGEERTALLPDSDGEMVWEVGNRGFDLYLSTSIPRLIGEHVPQEVRQLLDGAPWPELWAIHPGGRGIVDVLQELFGLSGEQTAPSRDVLRHYGNMSSVTILFVLKEMKRRLSEEGNREGRIREGVALAFGPGVAAEMLRFAYAPDAVLPGAMPRREELAAARNGDGHA